MIRFIVNIRIKRKGYKIFKFDFMLENLYIFKVKF